MARRRRPKKSKKNTLNKNIQQELQADQIQLPLPNFFKDQNNPYHRAPQYVQRLFSQQNGQLKFYKLQVDQDQCKKIKSQKNYENMCMTNINGKIFYICYTCFVNDQMPMCQKCFNLQDHKNHYYKMNKYQMNQYCICGKTVQGKYFSCQKHKQSRLDIEIQQNCQNFQNYIVNMIAYVLEILFYIQRRSLISENYMSFKSKLRVELKQFINQMLSQYPSLFPIIERSLDVKIISRPSEQDHPTTIFENIFRIQFTELLRQMLININFTKKFAYLWSKPENYDTEGVYYRKKFSQINYEQILHISRTPGILQFFCMQQIYPKDQSMFDQIFQRQGPSLKIQGKTALQLYLQYYKKQCKVKQYIQYLTNINQIQCNAQVSEFIVKELLQYLINNNKDQKAVQNQEEQNELQKDDNDQNSQIQDQEEQENIDEIQQKQESPQNQSEIEQSQQIDNNNQQNSQENGRSQNGQKQKQQQCSIFDNYTFVYTFQEKKITELHQKLNTYIFSMLDRDISNFCYLPQRLQKMGYDCVLIDDYLVSILKIKNEENNIRFQSDGVFLLMCTVSKNKQMLIKQYMKKITNDEFDLIVKLRNIFDIINTVAGIIIDRKFNQSQINQKKQQNLDLFRSYLYEKKKIQNYNLSSLKYENSHLLAYPQSNQIFRQLCTAVQNQDDEQQCEFVYTSQAKYPNLTIKLSLSIDQIIQVDYLTYSTQINLKQIQPILQQLLSQIFSDKIIFEKLQKQFMKITNKIYPTEQSLQQVKQNNYAIFYFYLLVLAHHFGNQQQNPTDQFIKQVQTNKIIREKYQKFIDKSQLQRLFNINQENNTLGLVSQNQEQKQKQRLQIIKEKAKLKKQKLRKKFQSRNQQYLGLHATKSINQAHQQDQQLCLLCREKSKHDNPLAYVTLVNKNHTLSYSIYGDQNISRTFISTCFHCIHLQCYTKIDKRNGYFSCLLCQKKCNCLIPKSSCLQSKRVFRLCTNILIANFVFNYGCLDVESIFILMFKHIIQSKGLHLLALGDRRYINKFFNDKVNIFCEKFLQEIYETSPQYEKVQYQKQISDFIEDIGKCTRIQFKQIQIILAKALRQKIINKVNTVSIKDISYLQKILNEQDLSIILPQLQQYQQVQQNRMPEIQLNQIKQKNKQIQSLIFKPKLPPPTSLQLPLFGINQCNYCESRQKYTICLICGITQCSQCYHANKHHEDHKNKVLSFMEDEGEITVKNNDTYQCQYIYRSCYGINLNEISFEGDINKDIYYLQQNKLEKAFKAFYDQ